MATAAELEYLRRQAASAKANKAQGLELNQGSELLQPQSNGWNDFIDTFSSAKKNFANGFFDVFEGIGDAVIGGIGAVAGLFGGEDATKWAKDAIEYDWSNVAANFLTQGSNVGNALFTGRWGEWVDNWSKLDQQRQYYDQDNIVKKASGFVGRAIPSIAAYALNPAVGIAVSSASSLGSGMESALKEGGDYYSSFGYGALQGAISGVTTAIMGAIGQGGVAGKLGAKAGESLANTLVSNGVKDATAVMAAKATQIAIKALGDGARGAITAAADPLLKQITFDQEAIEKAYGSDEARARTFANIGASALSSATFSVVMQSVPEAVKRVKLGKDGYTADYISQLAEKHAVKGAEYLSKAREAKTEAECNDFVRKAQAEYEKADGYKSTVLKYLEDSKNFTGDIGVRLGRVAESKSLVKRTLSEIMKNRESKSFDDGSFYDATKGTYTTESGRAYGVVLLDDEPVFAPKSVSGGFNTLLRGELPFTDKMSLGGNVVISESVAKNLADDGFKGSDIQSISKQLGGLSTATDEKRVKFRVNLQNFGEEKKGAELVVIADKKGNTYEVKTIVPNAVEITKEIAMSPTDLIKRANNLMGNKETPLSAWGDFASDTMTNIAFRATDAKSVSLADGTRELARTLFATQNLNGKEPTNAVISDFLDNGTFIVKDKDGNKTQVKLSDYLSKEDMEGLKADVKSYLDKLYDDAKQNKVTDLVAKQKAIEERLKVAFSKEQDTRKLVGAVRKINNNKKILRRRYQKPTDPVEITNRMKWQGKSLNDPFMRLHTPDNRLDTTDFAKALADFRKDYTEENWGSTAMGFSQVLSDLMDEYLFNYPDGSGSASGMEAEAVESMMRVAKQQLTDGLKRARKQYSDAFIVKQESDELGLNKDANKVQRFAERVVGFVNSPSATLKAFYLGENTLAGKQVDKVISAHEKAISWAWKKHDALMRYLNESGLAKKLDTEVEFQGEKIPYRTALKVYMYSKLPASVRDEKGNITSYGTTNRDDLDLGGFWFEKDGKRHSVAWDVWEDNEDGAKIAIDEDKLNALQAELREALGGDVADEAFDFLVNKFYSDDDIYEKMTYVRTGTHNPMDVEMLPKGTYLPNSVEGLHKPGTQGKVIGVFTNANAKSRVGNSNRGIQADHDPFSDALSYTSLLSKSYYVVPEVNELNAMVGDVWGDMTIEGQSMFYQFRDTQLEILKPLPKGFLTNGYITAAIATPKTAFTQLVSAFVGGSGIEDIAKRPQLVGQAIKPSGDYKKALETVLDVIPELETRGKRNEIMQGNGFGGFAQSALNHIAKAMSFGNNTTDAIAVRFVVLNSIAKGYDEMRKFDGFTGNIYDKEVIEYSSDLILEAYRSQISSSDKSPLQIGAYYKGTTPTKQGLVQFSSRVFSPFTGAVTALGRYVINNVASAYQWSKFDPEANARNIEADEKTAERMTTRAEEQEADALYKEIASEIAFKYENKIKENASNDPLLKGVAVKEANKELLDKEAELGKKVSNLLDEIEETESEEAKAELKEEVDELNHERRAYTEVASAIEKAEDEKTAESILHESVKAYNKGASSSRKAAEESKAQSARASASAKSRKNRAEWFEKYKRHGGGKKKVIDTFSGLILMGLGMMAITEIDQRIKGRKKWNEWDVADMMKETALNSTLNSVPVLRSITSYIENGYEITDPSTAMLNDMLGLVGGAKSLIESGFSADKWKNLLRSIAEAGGESLGIPVKQAWNYFYGIAKQANPDFALNARNLFYNITNTATKEYNSAVASGDDKQALAYLSAIAKDRVGEMSVEVQKELLNLSKEGYSALPYKVKSVNVDEDGNETKISWSEQQAMKRVYSKANGAVAKLIKTASYAKLDAKAKAKAINSVFNAYRAIANGDGLPKLALIAKRGAIHDLASAVAHISLLEATKTKSKKELALAYVNSLALSKGDKMIVLALAGYKVDEAILKRALRARGMSESDLKEFVKQA